MTACRHEAYGHVGAQKQQPEQQAGNQGPTELTEWAPHDGCKMPEYWERDQMSEHEFSVQSAISCHLAPYLRPWKLDHIRNRWGPTSMNRYRPNGDFERLS
jgi:hypothetical protein